MNRYNEDPLDFGQTLGVLGMISLLGLLGAGLSTMIPEKTPEEIAVIEERRAQVLYEIQERGKY